MAPTESGNKGAGPSNQNARGGNRQRSNKNGRSTHGSSHNTKLSEKPIKTLLLEDIIQEASQEIRIENYKFLASYNWTKDNEPTIFVPGAPALWSPPTLPVTIPKDDGQARVDENTQRVIAPSFAPFFAALGLMQPNYSLLPIQLVTDRNSLRKFYNFVSGTNYGWRMEAELVKDTLFLTRWEKDAHRIITGSLDSGSGHEFEKAFLKFEKGLEESSSHHRIVEYEVGGMKWVVRYEADGYFDDSATAVNDSLLADQISKSFETLSLQPDSQHIHLEGVKVIKRGYLVAPSSIVEVKSKTNNSGRLQLQQKIPQCWFSQTDHVFVGTLRDGLAIKVDRAEMSSYFEDWEQKHQGNLKKLVGLIKRLQQVAREVEDGKFCIISDHRSSPSGLRIFRSDDSRLALSLEVREKYWSASEGLSLP